MPTNIKITVNNYDIGLERVLNYACALKFNTKQVLDLLVISLDDELLLFYMLLNLKIRNNYFKLKSCIESYVRKSNKKLVENKKKGLSCWYN